MKREKTIEHSQHLDKLGYDRYRKDTRKVESHIESVRKRDLQSARDSFLKLRSSMEMTERKQKESEDNFNRSALEARKTLETIEK
mmetsp:Transcript_35507/g.43491  ORF Transcript_35507/g.43491 Transcript_35507/m.43491 type:complete len:85 (-) Transcript_35507:946-1200(-)